MKQFLRLGSVAALATFIPGARASVLLLLIGATYGPDAAATLGLSSQFLGLTIVALVGLNITTVFAIKKLRGKAGARTIAVERGAVAFAGACVITVVAVAAGVVLPSALPGIDPQQFLAYWYVSIISLVATVFTSWQTGLLQVRNADAKVLKMSLISASVAVASAIVITRLIPEDAVLALACVALVNAGSDAAVLVLRSRAVRGVWETELDGLWREALMMFLRAPSVAVRQLPRVAAAAADGLILMSVFLTAGLVATLQDVETGAAVLTATAVMRTLVLPLKQFGMVGGRLSVATDGMTAGLLRRMLTVVTALLAAGAGVLLLLKLVGILPASMSLVLVGLLAAQLLLEPVTGFLFACMKILEAPTFGMRALFLVSCAFTLPALLVLAGLRLGEPEYIWLVLLAARLAFAVAIVLGVRRSGTLAP